MTRFEFFQKAGPVIKALEELFCTVKVIHLHEGNSDQVRDTGKEEITLTIVRKDGRGWKIPMESWADLWDGLRSFIQMYGAYVGWKGPVPEA